MQPCLPTSVDLPTRASGGTPAPPPWRLPSQYCQLTSRDLPARTSGDVVACSITNSLTSSTSAVSSLDGKGPHHASGSAPSDRYCATGSAPQPNVSGAVARTGIEDSSVSGPTLSTGSEVRGSWVLARSDGSWTWTKLTVHPNQRGSTSRGFFFFFELLLQQPMRTEKG